MNCYNHPKTISVAQCQDCKKGLCTVCAKKYAIPICFQCNSKRGSSEKEVVLKDLFVIYGFGLIATYLIINNTNFRDSYSNINTTLLWVFMTYVYSSIIAGWKTLNKLTINYFIYIPIIGWLFGWFIYFNVKLIIAVTIGWFMLPIRTYNNLKKIKTIISIKKSS